MNGKLEHIRISVEYVRQTVIVIERDLRVTLDKVGAFLNCLNYTLAEEEVLLNPVHLTKSLCYAHDAHQLDLKLDLTQAVQNVLWILQ